MVIGTGPLAKDWLNFTSSAARMAHSTASSSSLVPVPRHHVARSYASRLFSTEFSTEMGASAAVETAPPRERWGS